MQRQLAVCMRRILFRCVGTPPLETPTDAKPFTETATAKQAGRNLAWDGADRSVERSKIRREDSRESSGVQWRSGVGKR